MVRKFVSLDYLLLLTLCLISGSISAEESVLLIDNSQGIDNTGSPLVNELNEIKASLKSIVPDEEVDKEKNSETEQPNNNETTAEPYPEKTIDPLNVGAETRTLLIDNRLGIDNVDEPLVEQTVTPVTTTSPVTVAPIVEPVVTAPPINSALDKTPISEPNPIAPVKIKAPAKKVELVSQKEIMQKPATSNIWIPKDTDLRILEIRVDSYTFEDVIGAYQHDNIIMLPLGAVSSIIDLAITVDPEFANGFIIKQDNTFALDISRNEVVIKGIISTYKKELVKSIDGDIYVESNLLGKWLDMVFDVDLYSSRLRIKSEEKLPFLARIEREKYISKTLSRIGKDKQEYPRHEEDYKNYTVPFVDQTVQLGQRFSDAGNVTTFNSITHATADLLQHESSWYLTANDQNGLDEFRVTFGRTNPEGKLLGFMNAKEYQFGHVTEPRVGLITLAGALKGGMTVSNFPIGMQAEYDRHRFIGELLPGWEVELYRNNALIGYQKTPINGQYDFQDVELLFGNNYFRLVFYGPRGEVKEELKNFQLNQAITKQGEHYYRISTIDDEKDGQRTTMQYDYGISKNLSSSFNLVSIPLQELTNVVQHDYLAAGLTGYWDALLASATIVSDSSSGSATQIDLQTRIDEVIIGIKDIYLNNFFSEEYLPTSAAISRSSKLDINTAISTSFLPRIPVTFGFRRDQYVNGGSLFEVTNLLSMSALGYAVTNQLTHQQVTNQQAISNGLLQFSTNVDQMRLRGTIGYAIKPNQELTNLALILDPGLYGDYRVSFGINHSLQQDLTELSAAAVKLSGKYSLTFGARYNSNNEINLDLTLSVGIGYEPRREQWLMNARTLANHGSVSARFFLDNNQDGTFNDGDEPIQDAGVRINGGYNAERSDEDGVLFLTGIPAHNLTDLVIAQETLEDPLWTAALDGVQVLPRPGNTIQIDFPITTTGEIDGTVYLSKDGRDFGVGRVTVEAVDKDNHVISTTETAYDGFYILSKIPMGDYHVRISEKQLSKLGVESANIEPITIKGDNPYVNGIDFTLKAVESN